MAPKVKLDEIRDWVRTHAGPRRYRHIQGVVECASRLALRHGLSAGKARLAAWLHDCAKELTREEMKYWLDRSPFRLDPLEKEMQGLWHSHAGAAIAYRKWGIRDPAVLEAIRCHTTGSSNMGRLAQVLFLADFIEPSREFKGRSRAARIAGRSLREGVLAKASMTLMFLLERKSRIHPRLVETWNGFLNRGKG